MIKQGTPPERVGGTCTTLARPDARSSGQSQTPAVNNSGPIAAAAAPDASSCNKYALHSTGIGFWRPRPITTLAFGAGFLPKDNTDQSLQRLRRHSVHRREIQDESGQRYAQAIYFEVLTQDTVSSAQGGLLGAEGNAMTSPSVCTTTAANLNDPWTPGGITSTYQTITFPSDTWFSRWVPAAGHELERLPVFLAAPSARRRRSSQPMSWASSSRSIQVILPRVPDCGDARNLRPLDRRRAVHDG